MSLVEVAQAQQRITDAGKIPTWWWVALATAIGALILATLWALGPGQPWIRDHEPMLRIISIAIGPIATIIAIVHGLVSRHSQLRQTNASLLEIVELGLRNAEAAKALGQLQAEVQIAKQELSDKEASLQDASGKLERASAELDRQSKELENASALLLRKEALIAEQNKRLKQVATGMTSLWRRPGKGPSMLAREKGPRIISFGNLKGGVGKTTLAANYAAFLSANFPTTRTLLIDLDFQGSLSGAVLGAAEDDTTESRVHKLFEAGDSRSALATIAIDVGKAIPRCWIIPANYDWASAENKFLFQYVVGSDGESDLRFRLAEALCNERAREHFDVVILDLPPRMTLGTVNALFASHGFVIPTVLDKLSAPAVRRFAEETRSICQEADVPLDLIGVVGNLTRTSELTPAQKEIWEETCALGYGWREDRDYGLGIIPMRALIANAYGEKIPYLLGGANGDGLREIFDPIFNEMTKRLGLQVPETHASLHRVREQSAQPRVQGLA